MKISAKKSNPKIDMRVSLAPHSDFDQEEEERAKDQMRKALRARGLDESAIEAEVKRVWS